MPYLLDILIAVVLGVCIFRGVKRGFIKAAFSVLTLLIAVILSFMFYVPFSEFVQSTSIGENVSQSLHTSVHKALVGSAEDSEAEYKSDLSNTTEGIIGEMKVPEFMFSSIMERSDFLVRTAKLSASEAVSEAVTGAFMKGICAIALFVIILVGLWILRIVLECIFKLPLLKEVNNIAGFAAGAVNGVLISYLIFTAITFLAGFDELSFIRETANNSYIYKNIYENNLLFDIFK